MDLGHVQIVDAEKDRQKVLQDEFVLVQVYINL